MKVVIMAETQREKLTKFIRFIRKWDAEVLTEIVDVFADLTALDCSKDSDLWNELKITIQRNSDIDPTNPQVVECLSYPEFADEYWWYDKDNWV